jgi:hypothetical protein
LSSRDWAVTLFTFSLESLYTSAPREVPVPGVVSIRFVSRCSARALFPTYSGCFRSEVLSGRPDEEARHIKGIWKNVELSGMDTGRRVTDRPGETL